MSKVIQITGDIGWDVTAKSIQNQLNEANGEDLIVELSSPGGFVFDGIEVYNLFKNYSGQITFTYNGLVASMASYIPMLPNAKRRAEENAVFMIHNVWSFAVGDHNELRKQADIMEGLTGLLSNAYAKISKKKKKEIKDLMNETTFLFGKEIVDAGFADELIPASEKRDKEAEIIEAKSRMEILYGKLKNKKQDVEKIAACLKDFEIENNHPGKFGDYGLPQVNDFPPMPKLNNKIPTGSEVGKNKTEVSRPMDLTKLKAEHPDIYAQAVNVGVKQVRNKIESHGQWFDVAPKLVMEAILNDEDFTPVHASKYAKAQLIKTDIQDRIDDDAKTPEVKTPEEKNREEVESKAKETDLLNRVMELSGGVN